MNIYSVAGFVHTEYASTQAAVCHGVITAQSHEEALGWMFKHLQTEYPNRRYDVFAAEQSTDAMRSMVEQCLVPLAPATLTR